MFDNIQTVNNARTVNSDININLFEDSYKSSDTLNPTASAGSEFTNWTNDGTLFKQGNSSDQLLSVPSLELINVADQIPEKVKGIDSESDLAQAPTDAQKRSAKMLEDLTKYAGDNNLAFSSLDAVGINNISQSWQRVFENCPKNGETKQIETGGQPTGMTTVGPDGQRIPVETGQTIDSYYKNNDGFYCHAHTINRMGAPGELERVMETENHTKIYLHNQLPANGEVRIDVLFPDGKTGVQINAQTNQLKEILKRIKETDKGQTTTPPAS